LPTQLTAPQTKAMQPNAQMASSLKRLFGTKSALTG
jgi:hypothetical protein